MKTRSKILTSLAALIAIIVVVVAARFTHRPLFHGKFGLHPEQSILPNWLLYPGPSIDNFGNLGNWDFIEDFSIIVVPGSVKYTGPKVPHENNGFFAFANTASGGTIKFRMQRRTLVLVDLRDNTKKVFAVSEGQISDIWKASQDDGFDLSMIPQRFQLKEIPN